jgi:hypothetical protein
MLYYSVQIMLKQNENGIWIRILLFPLHIIIRFCRNLNYQMPNCYIPVSSITLIVFNKMYVGRLKYNKSWCHLHLITFWKIKDFVSSNSNVSSIEAWSESYGLRAKYISIQTNYPINWALNYFTTSSYSSGSET